MFNYTFSNNVMIGALARPSMNGSLVKDNIACYSQFTSLDWQNDNNVVQNNLCQGSAGTGFDLPHVPC